MQVLSKSIDLKHKCTYCGEEFFVDVAYQKEEDIANHFKVKTREGDYGDNIVFMTDTSCDLGVRCPKCNEFNKIKVDV